MKLLLLLLAILFLASSWFEHGNAQEQFPPTITKMPPKEKAFAIGQPVQLECEAVGNPEPRFIWKRNGRDFDWTINPDRYELSPGTGTLVFKSPKRDDEGTYQCLVENELGVALTVKTLLRAAELQNFDQLDKMVVVRDEGFPAMLRCNPPRSYPEASILWYKVPDDTKVPIALNMSNRINTDLMMGDLMFANAISEDGNAVYQCAAKNDIVGREVMGREIRMSVNSRGFIPRKAELTWRSPRMQIGMAKKTLDLFCFFSGNPTPTIEWMKDGEIISTDVKWSKMEQLESGARLRLIDIDEETHAGKYQCIGTNNLTDSSTPAVSSFEVRVLSEPFWISQPTDVSVPEGGSHTFRCEAGGTDVSLRWLINGRSVSRLKDGQSPFGILNGTEFQFTDLALNDTLVVQCNCSNRYGYIFANAYLNVINELPSTILPTFSDEEERDRVSSVSIDDS